MLKVPLKFWLTLNSKGTSEVIVRNEVECAQENSDVADNTPKKTRKRRSSNENEPCVALGAVDVNSPIKKRGKPKSGQKEKEQPPTGTILAYTQHDKSKEASSAAVLFRHVLTVADTVIRMEQNMRNVHAKVKERLKVVLSDVNGLSKHLEQHISKCEEGRKVYSHKSFQYSCGDLLLPSLSAAVISMDDSSIHPAA